MKEFEMYLDIFENPNKLFSAEFKTIEELKNNCIYVLDTNVLLLPYTIGTKELSEIEKVYSKLIKENRLFIPAQVAKEFVKNRPKKLEEINKSISDFLSKINNFKIPSYPVLGQVEWYMKALALEDDLNKKVSEYKKEIKGVLSFIHNLNWDDPVSSIYKKHFNESCITNFLYDYKELNKELESRHKFNIPPAFKDKSKDDKGIGDFIIWKDIQQLSKENERDIIFVTGDEKADWFHQSMGTKLYPRYELQYEFYTNTNGNSFNIISLSDLIGKFSTNEEAVINIRTVEKLKRKSELLVGIKEQALARANNRCEICGAKGSIGDESFLNIIHITPLSKGGENSLDNIIVLCPSCSIKHYEPNLHDQQLGKLNRLNKFHQSNFIKGSPCQMSGQTCPSCQSGILDVSKSDPYGVECNKCGAFFQADFH